MSEKCKIKTEIVFKPVVGGIDMFVFLKQDYKTTPIDQIINLSYNDNTINPKYLAHNFGKFNHEDIKIALAFHIPIYPYTWGVKVPLDGIYIKHISEFKTSYNFFEQLEHSEGNGSSVLKVMSRYKFDPD